MKNKQITIVILLLIIAIPLSLKFVLNGSESNLKSISAYVLPPEQTTTHNNGFRFVELERAASAQDDVDHKIARIKSKVWTVGGENLNSNADELNTVDTESIKASHPFLSEIIEASSTGGKYLWWVNADQIPEGASGFEKKDTLIEITVVDRVAPVPAPDDVASIPSYATITPSGVGYYLLSEATTGAQPSLDDMVEVHYTGWQTNGKMFDSSVLREKTNTFPLGKLIEGWQKAVPLMHVGEKARIWIPGELAYDLRENRPHAPKGMLVFDIELVSIPTSDK